MQHTYMPFISKDENKNKMLKYQWDEASIPRLASIKILKQKLSEKLFDKRLLGTRAVVNRHCRDNCEFATVDAPEGLEQEDNIEKFRLLLILEQDTPAKGLKCWDSNSYDSCNIRSNNRQASVSYDNSWTINRHYSIGATIMSSLLTLSTVTGRPTYSTKHKVARTRQLGFNMIGTFLPQWHELDLTQSGIFRITFPFSPVKSHSRVWQT